MWTEADIDLTGVQEKFCKLWLAFSSWRAGRAPVAISGCAKFQCLSWATFAPLRILRIAPNKALKEEGGSCGTAPRTSDPEVKLRTLNKSIKGSREERI